MKPIKFRGFDGVDWVYGISIAYDKESDTLNMLVDDDWIYVNKISQFTGLYDKKGKGIFIEDLFSTRMYDETFTFEVSVDDFSKTPVLDTGDSKLDLYRWNLEGEVVGTIHDEYFEKNL